MFIYYYTLNLTPQFQEQPSYHVFGVIVVKRFTAPTRVLSLKQRTFMNGPHDRYFGRMIMWAPCGNSSPRHVNISRHRHRWEENKKTMGHIKQLYLIKKVAACTTISPAKCCCFFFFLKKQLNFLKLPSNRQNHSSYTILMTLISPLAHQVFLNRSRVQLSSWTQRVKKIVLSILFENKELVILRAFI